MAMLRAFTRTINGLKNKSASLTLSRDNNEVNTYFLASSTHGKTVT